jgi:hypothetical protein
MYHLLLEDNIQKYNMNIFKKISAIFVKKYVSRGSRFIINCYRLYYAFILLISLLLGVIIYLIICK